MLSLVSVFNIVKERYPDICFPGEPQASFMMWIVESTHTIWFRKPWSNGTMTRIMKVHDGNVSFRRPDENAYLETDERFDVRREIYRLADEGFVIDYQHLDVLLKSSTVYKPTEKK